MTTCTAHCSGCGTHFHSQAAFDAHRVGSFSEPVGSEDGRHCLHPIEVLNRKGEPRLVVIAPHGVCRMGGLNANGSDRSSDDVTIWTMAGFEEVGAQIRRSQEAAAAE